MPRPLYVHAQFDVRETPNETSLWHEYMVDWESGDNLARLYEDIEAWIVRGGVVRMERKFPPDCYKHIGPQPFPKDVNNG